MEPHGEMLPIGEPPPPLLNLELEHSLSENDEFLDDVLPQNSDLESEDLVWDIKGLVVDLLTEFGHDEVVLLCTSSTSVTTKSWTRGDQSNQSVIHKCSGCSQDYHP